MIRMGLSVVFQQEKKTMPKQRLRRRNHIDILKDANTLGYIKQRNQEDVLRPKMFRYIKIANKKVQMPPLMWQEKND